MASWGVCPQPQPVDLGRQASTVNGSTSQSAAAPRPSTRPSGRGQRRRVEQFGRVGLVARGVVYGVIGLLSLEVALGLGGKTTGQAGAMETIAHQPLGSVLLIILAVGLAGYAVWQLAIAVARLSGREGALDRVTAAIGAVGYGLLCFTAIKILVGSGASGDGSPKGETGGVLSWPGGPALIGAIGLVLIGVGLYQAYRGITREFLKESDTSEMSPPVRRGFVVLAAFGHVARAVIFLLIGVGLLKAAVDYSPRSAVGLDGALAKLAHTPAGPALLGAVAAGLIGFGLYSIADARYHRM
jgi:hypothetical protein